VRTDEPFLPGAAMRQVPTCPPAELTPPSPGTVSTTVTNSDPVSSALPFSFFSVSGE
jgi:hypothetical protein